MTRITVTLNGRPYTAQVEPRTLLSDFIRHEAGLTGMADPYCRGTYPWGREDETLIAAYRAAALRRKNKVLTRGDVRIEPGEESIKIIRTLAGEKVSFTVDTHGNFIWEDA